MGELSTYDNPTSPLDGTIQVATQGFGSLAALWLELPAAGAVIGAVVGDLAGRLLSNNQASRVERTLRYALELHQELLVAKTPIRTDFEDVRAKIGEIAEGILLGASKAYEEKKLHHLGHMLATAEFTNTPIENLHQALRYAEQLSYRQLCILAAIDRQISGSSQFHNEGIKGSTSQGVSEIQAGVFADIRFMTQIGLIQFAKVDMVLQPSDNDFITPSYLRLSYPGALLVKEMNLRAVPEKDLKDVLDVLTQAVSSDS